jgi:small conductance mechanosensitive channel
MEQRFDELLNIGMHYGLQIIGAVAILIAGWIAARIARSIVRRVLVRADADVSLTNFVVRLAYILIIVFAVVAALAKFGIETASFVAILGAAAFAIGFALQGSLSNFASGIMVLVFRPFRVGEYVEGAGVAGTVKEIQLFNTVLATPDNVKIIVPNSKMYGDVIKNYSANDTRRVDFLIGIGYDSSISDALEATAALIKADARILADPASQLVVGELGDSSVNLIVRAWVNKEDYWGVKFDLTRAIKESFDAQGIEIPFPQRVVHMRTQAGAA